VAGTYASHSGGPYSYLGQRSDLKHFAEVSGYFAQSLPANSGEGSQSSP
jgi:hypothetical protein